MWVNQKTHESRRQDDMPADGDDEILQVELM